MQFQLLLNWFYLKKWYESVRYVRRNDIVMTKETDDLPYAHDDEPFLQLVDRTYRDDQLHEWEPPSAVQADPESLGYMGTCSLDVWILDIPLFH